MPDEGTMDGSNGTADFVSPGLQRAEQTVYDPIWNEHNLLSLDGGGIRGYWTLLVLQFLMQAIGDEERSYALKQGAESVDDLHSFMPEVFPANVTHCPVTRKSEAHFKELDAERFLPCHYFDLICGSSTGSLIAIMLSRFRMTVRDCLQEYEVMSNMIFGKPRLISQRNVGFVKWSKYNAESMTTAFVQVTNRRGEVPHHLDRPQQRLIETKAGTCSMFAITFRKLIAKNPKTKKRSKGSVDTVYLLRSYEHRKGDVRNYSSPYVCNFGPAENLLIHEVARAATAAPMYFKKMLISNNKKEKEKVYYSDGGFGQTNNPTAVGIDEIRLLHAQNGEVGKLGAVVSVGTARAVLGDDGDSILGPVRAAFSMATNPQHIANSIQHAGLDNYWRINDTDGLDIELDEWEPKSGSDPGHKTLTRIRNAFYKWAYDRDNVDYIRSCAKELVRRRRLRAYGLVAQKWKHFATAVEYRCRRMACGYACFDHLYRFQAHCEYEHANLSETDKKDLLVPEITGWTYPEPPSIPLSYPNGEEGPST